MSSGTVSVATPCCKNHVLCALKDEQYSNGIAMGSVPCKCACMMLSETYEWARVWVGVGELIEANILAAPGVDEYCG